MNYKLPRYLRPASLHNSATEQDRHLVSTFAENGYVVIDCISDELIAIADRTIASVEPLYGASIRTQDAWKTVESVKGLALYPPVLRILSLLYGRKPFAFQTLNFPVGTQQLTHSDIIHFSSSPPDFMAGVWFALEDVDAGNGPLHYYPGTHRLPHLTLSDLNVSGSGPDADRVYAEHYEPAIQRLVDERGLVRREGHLKKGQAIIWAANLLHGGSPILDQNRTRHSQVTHYFFERCRYWTPLLSGPDCRFARYPLDISTGLHVTRFGRVNGDEGRLRRSLFPW
jgi:hypothetical protein